MTFIGNLHCNFGLLAIESRWQQLRRLSACAEYGSILNVYRLFHTNSKRWLSDWNCSVHLNVATFVFSSFNFRIDLIWFGWLERDSDMCVGTANVNFNYINETINSSSDDAKPLIITIDTLMAHAVWPFGSTKYFDFNNSMLHVVVLFQFISVRFVSFAIACERNSTKRYFNSSIAMRKSTHLFSFSLNDFARYNQTSCTNWPRSMQFWPHSNVMTHLYDLPIQTVAMEYLDFCLGCELFASQIE